MAREYRNFTREEKIKAEKMVLVVAVLVLGVGYALTTIDLKVNDDITVSPDDSNFDVNFTKRKL